MAKTGWKLNELKTLMGNEMLQLRINPIVTKNLKNIRDYIAEDREEYANPMPGSDRKSGKRRKVDTFPIPKVTANCEEKRCRYNSGARK